MILSKQMTNIWHELKAHIPFTIAGAVTGVIFMLLFRNIGHTASHRLFAIFHPGHVILSAMVTAAMFKSHKKQTKFWVVLLVGYVGSIGVATVSDSVMPYIGEKALGLHIPAHSEHHHHEHHDSNEQGHNHTQEASGHKSELKSYLHLGFIEEWYIVNPAAILGVLIAWWLPKTKFPHAGHVLISTWASSAHVLMTTQQQITLTVAMSMLAILFLATWLPCCVSDIVFPLLVTGKVEHHCCCNHN